MAATPGSASRVRSTHESVERNGREIAFVLKRTSRRTLAISVLPDGSVEVIAPKGVATERIKERVSARAQWIRKQQRAFAALPPALPAKPDYRSGDSWRYLGRKYVLRTVRDRTAQRVSFRFEGNRFVVRAKAPSDTALLRAKINDWYLRHARRVFGGIVESCAERLRGLGIANPGFALRRMDKRLGSCAPSGKLLLDPRLVEASTALIEFVVVHELCHQRELNHGPAFFRLMDKALPDWRERERKLLRYEFST
jgi:predicted metal-dependent hydrolase